MKYILLTALLLSLICAGCVNTPEPVNLQATIDSAVAAAVEQALTERDFVTQEQLEQSQTEQNESIRDYVSGQIAENNPSAGSDFQSFTDTSAAVTDVTSAPQVQATIAPEPYVFSDCTNSFAYVSDVNVPDGSNITRNTVFTKSWFITNTGTCTWNNNYKLVYYSGDKVGTSESFDIVAPDYFVKPGESVVVSAEIQASAETNHKYTTQWAMKAPGGEIFGAGATKTTMLSSSYVISETYSFVQNFYSAQCSDDFGSFTCGATSRGKGRGVAYYEQSPTLESGVNGDPGFFIGVPFTEGGKSRITFNSIRMPRGSWFYTSFCCRQNTPGCNVIVRLYVQEEGYPEKLLIERTKYNTGFLDEFKFKTDEMGIYENNYKYIFEVEAVGEGDPDDLIIFMNAKLY